MLHGNFYGIASIILLFGFLGPFSGIPSNAHPLCLNEEPPQTPQPPLGICTRFNGYPGSCCTSTQEITLVDAVQRALVSRARRIKETCSQLLQTILCASCSPLSAHIFGIERKGPLDAYPSLCNPFCSRFYAECGNVTFDDFSSLMSDTHVIPGFRDVTNTSYRLRDRFPTERAYCDQFGSWDPNHCVTDRPEEPVLEPTKPTGDMIKLSLAFPRLKLSEFFSGTQKIHIVDVKFSPKASNLTCVVFQTGQIIAFPTSSFVENSNASLLLNISDRVTYFDATELGLLGMTFDPNFQRNGYIYVKYTFGGNLNGTVRVSRFWAREGSNNIDTSTERIILEVERDASMHHGGPPVFSSGDGLMFIPMGDGRGFSFKYAIENHPSRNMSSLRGKILRINTTISSSEPNEYAGALYTIPPSNPWTDLTNIRPEIFAFGVRNPWRVTFDTVRQELWAIDVGSYRYDEINRITKGADLGWNRMEGNWCFDNGSYCDSGVPKNYVYAHENYDLCKNVTCYEQAVRALVAGAWYHGDAVRNLKDRFVYADYESNQIYALTVPDRDRPETSSASFSSKLSLIFDANGNSEDELVGQQYFMPVAFAEDQNNEVYVANWMHPQIFKLESA